MVGWVTVVPRTARLAINDHPKCDKHQKKIQWYSPLLIRILSYGGMSYLGTYWQVYETMVDGVRWEKVKLWLPIPVQTCGDKKSRSGGT
ncbi:hypothetical protein GB937_002002 [Aspergillus fischeri]|nr:hypothetical protein GB937_002002 [Aspergillus fischeri]